MARLAQRGAASALSRADGEADGTCASIRDKMKIKD